MQKDRHLKLLGKTAIVTGGAMGIGRGAALCLAEDGADVTIADLAVEAARKTAEDIKAFGRRALIVIADCSQQTDAEKLVAQTRDTFGRVDILVNNVAGTGRQTSTGAAVAGNRIADLPISLWDDTYEGVLKTQVLMSRAVMPLMRAQGGGKIINIASIAAKVGDQSRMAYSSLKGAVISFTRALAREGAPDNITVNSICPGLIYTPGWQVGAEKLLETVPAYKKFKDPKEIFLRYVEKLTPMGQELTAEDIGRAIAFFASDDARYITGQSLNVDGGIVMD